MTTYNPTKPTAAMPVGSYAAVMGTGIVSVALHVDRVDVASDALFAIAALAWAALSVLVWQRWLRAPRPLLAELRSPAALTTVAASAVLGARAVDFGSTPAGLALLALACAAWAPLTLSVLRSVPARTSGGGFMLTVAPEGLATLAALLAAREGAAWLAEIALVLATIGIGLYPFVLVRFDWQALTAGRGEQWVAGGALAISALALAEIAATSARLPALRSAAGALDDASLVMWVAAMCWLPLLAAAELIALRVRYDLGRWSTVFPLGMYAVASFAVAAAAGAAAPRAFARIWVWVAVAGWAAVSVGAASRMASGLRPPGRTRRPRTSESDRPESGG